MIAAWSPSHSKDAANASPISSAAKVRVARRRSSLLGKWYVTEANETSASVAAARWVSIAAPPRATTVTAARKTRPRCSTPRAFLFVIRSPFVVSTSRSVDLSVQMYRYLFLRARRKKNMPTIAIFGAGPGLGRSVAEKFRGARATQLHSSHGIKTSLKS